MDTEASLPMETALPLHLQPSNGLYSKLPGAMEDATDKAKPLHHDTDSPPHLQPAIQAENHVRVLGIPVHKMSRPIQFIVCVAGTLILYLLYGYTQVGLMCNQASYEGAYLGHPSQEWIFSVPDFHPLGWYFTLVQFGFYSVFGYVEMKITGEKQRYVQYTRSHAFHRLWPNCPLEYCTIEWVEFGPANNVTGLDYSLTMINSF